MYDSAGESIDLLQTVRHPPPPPPPPQLLPLPSSSSVPVTSAGQHLAAAVKVSRRTNLGRASSGLGKRRPVSAAEVLGDRRCSDHEDDDDDDARYVVEPATSATRHCHCCCHCRHSHSDDVADVEDDGGGFQRLRSALDDDDSDAPVSYVERDRLPTPGGLYLPPLFVTSAPRRSVAPRTVGAETGDDLTASSRTTVCCRQPPTTCLSRWWSGMFRRRRRDVARHRRDNDDDDDDDCIRNNAY